MSSIVVRCINNLVMILAIILTTQNVTNKKVNLFSIRTVFWIGITFLPCLIFVDGGYNLLFTTLSLLFFSFSLKNIFQIDLSETMFLTLCFMISSILPDLIFCMIGINFINYSTLINNQTVTIFTNLLTSLFTTSLFRIPAISKFLSTAQKHLRDVKYKDLIIFVLIASVAIGIAYYIIVELYKPTRFYFTTNVIIIIMIMLIFIYMLKVIKYDQLKSRNDVLYECMKNIESYQEKQDLKIHEYKNQLSKITAITTDEKIIDKIEEILDVDLTADTYLLGKIKNIPKGELKSLIYYKLLVAKRENVNISIDISSDLTDENYEFNKRQEKSLSHLIGISFDNAIEAARDSKERELFLGIYETSVGMTFSITNTFSGNIDLDKIGQLGYTTKGENHGKGLHFMKKIVENKIGLYTRTTISNNYFTQKIIIKEKTDK